MSAEAARRYDPEPLPPDPGDGSPEAFLNAVRSALEADRVTEARRLAERAALLFPGNEDVQKTSRVLRPGRVRSVDVTYPDPSASFDWLRKNARQHRGQWVAVQGGELVAASRDFREVVRVAQERDVDFVHFVE